MAAVTEANRQDPVMGAVRLVTADLTSVDNNDTWDCGLDTPIAWSFTAQTNATVGVTQSAGVFTFANTGSIAVRANVWGV